MITDVSSILMRIYVTMFTFKAGPLYQLIIVVGNRSMERKFKKIIYPDLNALGCPDLQIRQIACIPARP